MNKTKKSKPRKLQTSDLPAQLRREIEKQDRSHLATSLANEALSMGAHLRDALAMVHANVEECRPSMN